MWLAAAAQYLQAVVRGYLLRKSDNRDLLRARLDAYSKWTPATLFRAYCKFAQQTTTARAFKGAKLEIGVFCAKNTVVQTSLAYICVYLQIGTCNMSAYQHYTSWRNTLTKHLLFACA